MKVVSQSVVDIVPEADGTFTASVSWPNSGRKPVVMTGWHSDMQARVAANQVVIGGGPLNHASIVGNSAGYRR